MDESLDFYHTKRVTEEVENGEAMVISGRQEAVLNARLRSLNRSPAAQQRQMLEEETKMGNLTTYNDPIQQPFDQPRTSSNNPTLRPENSIPTNQPLTTDIQMRGVNDSEMIQEFPMKLKTKKLDEKSRSQERIKKLKQIRKKEISSKCEKKSAEKKRPQKSPQKDFNQQLEKIKRKMTQNGKALRKQAYVLTSDQMAKPAQAAKKSPLKMNLRKSSQTPQNMIRAATQISSNIGINLFTQANNNTHEGDSAGSVERPETMNMSSSTATNHIGMVKPFKQHQLKFRKGNLTGVPPNEKIQWSQKIKVEGESSESQQRQSNFIRRNSKLAFKNLRRSVQDTTKQNGPEKLKITRHTISRTRNSGATQATKNRQSKEGSSHFKTQLETSDKAPLANQSTMKRIKVSSPHNDPQTFLKTQIMKTEDVIKKNHLHQRPRSSKLGPLSPSAQVRGALAQLQQRRKSLNVPGSPIERFEKVYSNNMKLAQQGPTINNAMNRSLKKLAPNQLQQKVKKLKMISDAFKVIQKSDLSNFRAAKMRQQQENAPTAKKQKQFGLPKLAQHDSSLGLQGRKQTVQANQPAKFLPFIEHTGTYEDESDDIQEETEQPMLLNAMEYESPELALNQRHGNILSQNDYTQHGEENLSERISLQSLTIDENLQMQKKHLLEAKRGSSFIDRTKVKNESSTPSRLTNNITNLSFSAENDQKLLEMLEQIKEQIRKRNVQSPARTQSKSETVKILTEQAQVQKEEPSNPDSHQSMKQSVSNKVKEAVLCMETLQAQYRDLRIHELEFEEQRQSIGSINFEIYREVFEPEEAAIEMVPMQGQIRLDEECRSYGTLELPIVEPVRETPVDSSDAISSSENFLEQAVQSIQVSIDRFENGESSSFEHGDNYIIDPSQQTILGNFQPVPRTIENSNDAEPTQPIMEPRNLYPMLTSQSQCLQQSKQLLSPKLDDSQLNSATLRKSITSSLSEQSSEVKCINQGYCIQIEQAHIRLPYVQQFKGRHSEMPAINLKKPKLIPETPENLLPPQSDYFALKNLLDTNEEPEVLDPHLSHRSLSSSKKQNRMSQKLNFVRMLVNTQIQADETALLFDEVEEESKLNESSSVSFNSSSQSKGTSNQFLNSYINKLISKNMPQSGSQHSAYGTFEFMDCGEAYIPFTDQVREPLHSIDFPEQEKIQFPKLKIEESQFPASDDHLETESYLEVLEQIFSQNLSKKLVSYHLNKELIANKEVKNCIFDSLVDLHMHQLFKRRIHKLQFTKKISKQQPLLKIHDLNMNRIIDSYLLQKLERNSKMVMVDEQNLRQSLRSQLIFGYLHKFMMRKMITASDHLLSELEAAFKEKHTTVQMRVFKNFKTYKVANTLLLARFSEESEKRMLLLEKKWLLQQNKAMFIQIINPEKLNKYTQPVYLFTIRTKIEVEGFIQFVHWKGVELKCKNFQSRSDKMNKAFGRKLQRQFNKIFLPSSIIYQDIPCENNCCRFRKINSNIMKKLHSRLESSIRVVPMEIRYKTGLCLASILKIINNGVLYKQGYDKIARMYIKKDQDIRVRNHDREKQYVDKLIDNGVPFRFKDYPCYHYVCNNEFTQFIQLLFNNTPPPMVSSLPAVTRQSNIYQRLYQIENDSVIFTHLNFIHQFIFNKYLKIEKVREMELQKYLNQFRLYKVIDYKNPVRRCQTLRSLPQLQQQEHIKIQRSLFPAQEKELENVHSLLPLNDPFMEAMLVRKYRRQGAQDRFNQQACGKIITQMLNQASQKNKDCSNIFYKKVIKLLNQEDKDANEIWQNFGYKYKLIRDIQEPATFMEIIQPVLLEPALLKIASYEARMRRVKVDLEFKSLEPLQQAAELDEMYREEDLPLRKEIKAVMPEEVLTDNTMKELNYEEVKSIRTNSDLDEFEEEAMQLKKATNHHRNLNQKQIELIKKRASALDYYMSLKRKDTQKRHPKVQMKFESVKHKVFKIISEDYIAEEKEMNKTTNKRTIMKLNKLMSELMMELNKDSIIFPDFMLEQRKYILMVKKKSVEQELSSSSPKRRIQFAMDSPSVGEIRSESVSESISDDGEDLRPQQSLIIPPMHSPKKTQFFSLTPTRTVDLTQLSFLNTTDIRRISSPPKDSQHAAKNRFSIYHQLGIRKSKTVNFDKEESSSSEEESVLELENEIEMQRLFQEHKRNQKNLELKEKRTRQAIFRMIHQDQTAKKKVITIKHSNVGQKKMAANSRLKRKMRDIVEKYGLDFKLEVLERDKLQPSALLMRQITEAKATNIKYSPEFKKKIFELLTMQNYAKFEDMLRRYHITSENIRDDKGNSLVALAAMRGDARLVKIMLLKGLNANTQNYNGDTALHFAIKGNYRTVIEYLIQDGADETIANNQGIEAWEA